ncbi:MAG: ClpXP protease specificity-enhancing factor [Candidatus Dactylopiibacterium sp.]|nr:ClpXP protease specificity-enhancing factor [Candidatus Dactylopiibacterium sp.]
MSSPTSSATKPYLVRAIYDWCVEGGFTPYVAVLVDERTRVPMQHVREGQIVLNVAPYATNKLLVDAEALSCQARFSGRVENLYVPLTQILAIYARENGQGLAFQPGVLAGSAAEFGAMLAAAEGDAAADASGMPEDISIAEPDAPVPLASVPDPVSPPEPPPATPGGKVSHLRRVK